MKKFILLLGVVLILFSCKKEKFNLGRYKITVDGTYFDDQDIKHKYSTNVFADILSETDTKLEIKKFDDYFTYPSLFLDKKGRSIEGNSVGISSPDGFYIKGSRNVFNGNISGKFETSLGTSIDGYFHYIPMTGKFKMIKQ